jgi:hypothetical protein
LKPKRVLAWVLFVGSWVGFVLSAIRVIAKSEPLIVLLLSWGALIYESTNTLFLTEE